MKHTLPYALRPHWRLIIDELLDRLEYRLYCYQLRRRIRQNQKTAQRLKIIGWPHHQTTTKAR